jgi:protein-S-isoprenylcysteine O-methyltransferase Ste14
MRSRWTASLGSSLFFVLAPCVVAGFVPWWLTRWTIRPALFGLETLRYFGGALVAIGVAIVLDCFRRFAWEGRGTPAPIAPTETLVVSGIYRYVRNPMYVGVVAAVIGQALWFGDHGLLAYATAVWLGFHTFVVLYEEPTLRRRYGMSYESYCRSVPRWIPRLRA